jgi:hypothetical protein
MNQVYIAMGQGVVAPADVEIFTEILLECTFIAGYRAGGSHGGAFHYPARTIQSIGPTIQEWMVALQPAAITLLFAVPTQFGTGTTPSDQVDLQRWFRERFPHVPVTTGTATAAFMTLARGRFYAGPVQDRSHFDPETGTNLEFLEPGRHANYELFSGESLVSEAAMMTLDAQATMASGPRRRRKRSWMKRHCVVM